MKPIVITGLAALIATSGTARAVEIVAGELTLGLSGFTGQTSIPGDEITLPDGSLVTETDEERLSRTALQSSTELAFGESFGLQGDLGFHRLGGTGESGTAAGLHGIYHAGPASSVGVFYSTAKAGSLDASYFGVEVASELGIFDAEAYYGKGELDDLDAALYGFSGRYALTPEFEVGLEFDRAKDDEGSVRRIGAVAAYDVTDRVKIEAEVGQGRVEIDGISDSDAYVGLRGTYSFGGFRGATFEPRGFLDILPGL